MNCGICNQGMWGDNDNYHIFIQGTEVTRFCEDCGWKVNEAVNKIMEEVTK